ncbi:GTPase ObgE [Candidatus Peregrinibacteria bacterium]|nr:GTPase ObgE [Candidatus Peregrinibacteria bacterium]
MHFCDEAHIKVKAGSGGNGAMSFRREKYIPLGGPDGGNGGTGGNIILAADPNLNTLTHFLTQKHFEAESGEKGGTNDRYGKKGEDLILKVPVGTIIREEGTHEKLADLSQIQERVVIVRGGRGGKGNANFKSSTRQAPDFAELGEPGQEKELYLELKLIADIAIIGYPSVGKSTLISRISNARPKIADYPFTTLVPNLGVVKVDDVDFVVADIPGLIEGAHEGKGLGIEFLRHIERSKVLVHLLDSTREDLKADYKTINNELACYSKTLAKQKQVLVVNKIDALPEEAVAKIRKQFSAKKPLFISCVAGKGLKELLYKLKEVVQQERKRVVSVETRHGASSEEPQHVFRPHLQLPEVHNYTVRKLKNDYRVSGKRLEQIAVMTDFGSWGGLQRLRDVFKKVGVQKELIRLGAQEGDKIYIGEQVFDFIKLD